MKKQKDLKDGVGFSVTATTMATIERWIINLQKQRRDKKINRGHVLALIVSVLDSIGWRPGMKVTISAIPITADTEGRITTSSPQRIQLAKSISSSAKP